MPRGWRVDERRGDAASLHASWPGVEGSPGERTIAVCHVPSPSVVLGSTQPTEVLDPVEVARRRVGVARRRSGGGAVLVVPGEPVWVDLWVPAADPLWSDDVGRAFDWVGDSWVVALERLGLSGLAAHRSGTLACTAWSKQVCFGGIGRGEVLEGGRRKVVGLAQRRTRAGAWFHCACALQWDPRPLVELLALSREERVEAVGDLGEAAVGAADLAEASGTSPVDAAMVTAALLDALPTGSGS